MNWLEEILANKRAEVAAQKGRRSAATLRAESDGRPAPPAFAAALRSAPMGLIAEVKRRSPSAGTIREPFDPPAIAAAYEAAGAQALSVLVDARYFGGGEEAFRSVRAAVKLPLLYKEFVVDAWQVWHAAALGASAVLLIAAALPRRDLEALLAACDAAGLEALLEVHDEDEADLAAALGARCIGVNNRDLRTFTTSLETTFRVRPRIPASALLVSESGIRSAEDVRRLREGGAGAVLVGEHLLRRQNLGAAVAELMREVWPCS
jgi:indole-3-glycerol phosphate synthase